jgi:hypothetical protein
MTRTYRDRLRAATGVLAALAVGAGMSAGVLAAPANASEHCGTAEDGGPKYGCETVTEPSNYLVNANQSAILHIETGYTDAGFWYARKVDNSHLPGSPRNFTWNYRPYGMWCGYAAREVGWNKWMGRHTCLPDAEYMAAHLPGYIEARDACRVEYDKDYMEAMPNGGVPDNGFYCDGWVYGRSEATFAQGKVQVCAPWEDQSTNASGHPNCLYTDRYEWEGADYQPPVESTDYLASATATETASATATETQTRTRKARVHRDTVRKVVFKKFRGTRYRGVGRQKIFISRKATRTASATVTRTATKTATRSCVRSTLEQAQTCAQNQASSAALSLAQGSALSAAQTAAGNQAGRKAAQRASATALRQATNAPIGPKVRKTANRKALRKAKRNLRRNIYRATGAWVRV